MPGLEIAVISLRDALLAQEGGADSIEICDRLALGGLTPDFELVENILKAVRLDVHVIIRPQAQSFQYTPEDVEIILRDTQRAAALGVKSIVFGAQDAQGRLDLELIHRVKRAASPVPLTIHRALDLSVDPEQSLEALVKLRIRRVLTSGPAANAWEGRLGLAKWAARFGAKLGFVVSGGLKLEELAEIAAIVRAQEYHLGSAARTGDGVDIAKVRRLRACLKSG